MRRILKQEPKKRVKTYPYIEEELLKAIDVNGLDLSNTFNIALEKHLAQKGLNIPCEVRK